MDQWTLKWKVTPPPAPAKTGAVKKTATVELILDIQLKSMMYDQMLALLPVSFAERMMADFQRRFEELDELERKARLQKIKEKSKAEAAKKEETKKTVPAKAAPKKLEVRAGKTAGAVQTTQKSTSKVPP